jgi:hypothetical protein
MLADLTMMPPNAKETWILFSNTIFQQANGQIQTLIIDKRLY